MVDMIAHVPIEDYMALKSREAVINNCIRRKDGNIRSNGIVLKHFKWNGGAVRARRIPKNMRRLRRSFLYCWRTSLL